MSLLEPMAPWMREFNRLFTTEGAISSFLPPADVIVTQEAVDVFMDVPGIRAESLNIELENETLTVRGERPWPYEPQDNAVRRIERRFGRFERSMRIPGGLDAEAVDATLQDGVLSLHVPMPQAAQPQRVEIKSRSSQQTIEAQAQEQQQQQQQQGATPQQDPTAPSTPS